MIKRVKEEVGKGGKRLTWAFPGGKMVEGQTRETCTENEVKAETGVRVVAERLITLRSHPDFPVIIAYFACRPIDSNPILETHEPDEVAEIRWVKPEEIKGLITTSLDPKVAEELNIA